MLYEVVNTDCKIDQSPCIGAFKIEFSDTVRSFTSFQDLENYYLTSKKQLETWYIKLDDEEQMALFLKLNGRVCMSYNTKLKLPRIEIYEPEFNEA